MFLSPDTFIQMTYPENPEMQNKLKSALDIVLKRIGD
jgi:hypothetical protein